MGKDGFIIDACGLQEYLRDRYPYLYVDGVTEICEDKYIKSVKMVSYNEWYFPCHFPGDPVVPGLIQLESVFQSAAVLIASKPGNKEKTVYIQKVNNAVFHKPVRPGSVMNIEAYVTRSFRRGVGEFSGKVTVNGETVCETDFRMVVADDIVMR